MACDSHEALRILLQPGANERYVAHNSPRSTALGSVWRELCFANERCPHRPRHGVAADAFSSVPSGARYLRVNCRFPSDTQSGLYMARVGSVACRMPFATSPLSLAPCSVLPYWTQCRAPHRTLPLSAVLFSAAWLIAPHSALSRLSRRYQIAYCSE